MADSTKAPDDTTKTIAPGGVFRVIKMMRAKETKSTWVYEGVFGDDMMPSGIKNVYIDKWMLGANPPDEIEVEVRRPLTSSIAPVIRDLP